MAPYLALESRITDLQAAIEAEPDPIRAQALRQEHTDAVNKLVGLQSMAAPKRWLQ